MDCEKFESTLIDELYDELDDLTSAEAKRHASGCTRCGGLLAGLRATRKLALLPVVMPPPDMEERILSAAREAHKVVPLKSRLQRVMSRAGSWAMRPQTAMAAVFLLAIGSSFVFMQRKDKAPTSVTVKAEGAPVTLAVPTAAPTTLDTKSAFGAHGTEEKSDNAKQLVAQGSSDVPLTSAPGSNADLVDGLGRSALAKDKNAYAENDELNTITNAAAPAGAPPAPVMQNGPAQEAQSVGGGGRGTASGGVSGPMDFNTAMGAYRARRFEEAARDFDLLAATDTTSALWAARSVREARGCAAAVVRFDAVKNSAFGTTNGYEAALDAGRCYRELGSFALARERLNPLLGVPAYSERAQEELDNMAPSAKKPAAAPRALSPAPAATSTGAATDRAAY